LSTKWLISLLAVVAVSGIPAGCGSDDDSGSGGGNGSASSKGSDEVYKIVVSNNFLGNDFRPQMLRLAELTAKEKPFAGRVELQVVNAESTTSAHASSLNNIIQSRPDAILVDASSPTALNGAVKRACAADIVVVSFDQPVEEPCAYRVLQDHGAGQEVVGQWMAQAVGNGGRIFVDRGLPGAPISKVIEDSFRKGLGDGVEVVGEYDGQYAPGPEQQGISQLLVGNKDVDGVMTQGYCAPAFKAFKQAGLGLPKGTTCYGYNGELVACARQKANCAILTGSPAVVQVALKLAFDVLEGKDVPDPTETVPVPMKLYVTGGAFKPARNEAGVEIEEVKLGENAYPDQPPGLALPFTLPEYDISPEEAAGK
jgi:ribose transport system substrate-binding protein